MNNERAEQLIKKLHMMANHGNETGERANAARLLQELLVKHNMTLEDIEKVDKHRCKYDIMVKHQKLFWSIVWNVIQDWDGRYTADKKHKRIIYLDLTNAEQLELTAKFDHYVRHYDKQLNLFTEAFIHRHEIYANFTPEYRAEINRKGKSASGRNRQELMTLMNLANGIEYNPYKQRIEDMSRLIE